LQSDRLNAVARAEQLAQGCDLVISAVTAGQAVDAARAVAAGIETNGWYFDINSVAPGTKLAVAAAVPAAAFVEGAVMAPIDPKRSQAPILIAGDRAGEFMPVIQALGFTGVSVASQQAGAASASKMCRSVMIKGVEALLMECLVSAQHYGVTQPVIESLNNLFPGIDWTEKSHYMLSRSLEHGTRRAEEMEQVAITVADAGIEPLMSSACVQRQRFAAGFSKLHSEPDLKQLLDSIYTKIDHQSTQIRSQRSTTESSTTENPKSGFASPQQEVN
jgi:3-hydroxyisobutyrate dehydrogenase-like beta-hydroxyacid dehydrogenase